MAMIALLQAIAISLILSTSFSSNSVSFSCVSSYRIPISFRMSGSLNAICSMNCFARNAYGSWSLMQLDSSSGTDDGPRTALLSNVCIDH